MISTLQSADAAAPAGLPMSDTADAKGLPERLAREDRTARRQAMFIAQQALWHGISGDVGQAGSYHARVVRAAAAWREAGSPFAIAADAFGVTPAAIELMLVRVLEAWKHGASAERLQPWDWFYVAGEARRRFMAQVPRDRLRDIVERSIATSARRQQR